MDSGKARFVSKPVWMRFGLSFLFVMAAFTVTSALWLIVDRPISSVLFLVAIVLSSWYCGFRAGLFATILSGLLLDYYFITPTYEILGDKDEIMRFILFLIEGSIISWLLDAQRIATDEIAHSREQLQALSNHLHTVRESEQKRIALEIHDELGQALTGVKMGVHWLSRQIAEKNGDLKLRPSILDDFGLVAAIEWQIQEFERMSGIPCDFRSDMNEIEIDPEVSTAVFRIFQEALTNIARHSDASTVEIRLDIEATDLVLLVTDDGRGIRAEELHNKRSLGILGMKERAKLVGGTVSLSPSRLGGTEVRLAIPLSPIGKIAGAAA
jgi:signal transduction histidine kinase